MTQNEILNAMDLPPGCLVNKRVPKAVWPDPLRTALGDATEELRWLAILKPETCAIAAHPDALEIQILALQMREGAKSVALERLHQAIPYPVLAFAQRGRALSLSLHEIECELQEGATASWLSSLALARQNHDSLATVYTGWVAAVRRLAEPGRIAGEMAHLRAQARKEKRMAALASINLRLQQLQSEFAAAREALCR